jgi:serine/threonine-protein kinase HipA
LSRIAQAMHSTMEKAKGDPRVPEALRAQMAQAWESGYGYAK